MATKMSAGKDDLIGLAQACGTVALSANAILDRVNKVINTVVYTEEPFPDSVAKRQIVEAFDPVKSAIPTLTAGNDRIASAVKLYCEKHQVSFSANQKKMKEASDDVGKYAKQLKSKKV